MVKQKIKFMVRQYYLFIGISFFIVLSCNIENSKTKDNDKNDNETEKLDYSLQIKPNKGLKHDEFKDLKIELGETIFLGKNIGKIINYKPRRKDIDYLLSVIIDNEYEDDKIVKDTFSDGTLAPWFGVYAHKKGIKNIRGVILEEALNDKIADDSILRIERTFIHFSKNVYVVDSVGSNIIN